jgi:tetratricopeptide (TPR) repeat protein
MLLVLDNAEDALSDVRDLVRSILQAGTACKILVTSRVPLSMPEETIFAVQPLAMTVGTDSKAPAQPPAALDLFMRQARRSQPLLNLDVVANKQACMDIVRVLGGHPLAIELAASNLRAMTLQELRTRLDLSLLQSDAPGRHASLGDVLSRSVALLSPQLRDALAALSVFSPLIDRLAAEHVLLKVGLAVSALGALAAYGLLSRESDDTYAWLVPVRQLAVRYGGEQLRRRAARAHCEYFAATTARAMATGEHVVAWAVRNLPDLQTALGHRRKLDVPLVWAIDSALSELGQIEARDALLARLHKRDATLPPMRFAKGQVLRERGALDQARIAFERVADGQPTPTLDPVRAAIDLAELDEIAGDTASAHRQLERALAQLTNTRTVPSRKAWADVMLRRAHVLRREGSYDTAANELNGALQVATRDGHRALECAILYELGVIDVLRMSDSKALRSLRACRALAESLGHSVMIGAADAATGIVQQAQGKLTQAIGSHAAAVQRFREIGQPHREASALYSLGTAYIEADDVASAERVLADAALLASEVGATRYIALIACARAVAHHKRANVRSARAQLEIARDAAASCRSEKQLLAVVALASMYLTNQNLSDEARSLVAQDPGDDSRCFLRFFEHKRRRVDRRVVISGATVRVDDGPAIDLARRRPLLSILRSLIAQRQNAPGETLSLDALVSAGWPEEKMTHSSAKNRAHVALSTMRALGLRAVLVSNASGYLLDPSFRIESNEI